MNSSCAAIVVMGVSGCGKSAVGLRIAQTLGLPFVEGDDLHPPENVAKMRAGEPLNDTDRAPWLAAIGTRIAAAAATHSRVVVACSALKRAYRDTLRSFAACCFVHLSAPKSVIAARIAERSGHFMPASLLDSQFEALEPPTAEEALCYVVDATQPLEAVVKKAILSAVPVQKKKMEEDGGVDSSLLMQGWLWKQGGKRSRAWRKRYCMFAAGALIYFHTADTSQAPRGSIDLAQVTRLRVEAVSAERSHVIVLHTPARDWFLSPDDPAEAQSWHDAILAVTRLRAAETAPKTPSPPQPLSPLTPLQQSAPLTVGGGGRVERAILEELPLSVVLRPHHGEGALLEVLLRRDVASSAVPLATPVSYRFAGCCCGGGRSSRSRVRFEADPCEGTILFDSAHLVIVRPAQKLHGNVDAAIELYIWTGVLEDADQPEKQLLFALVPVQLRGTPPPPPPPPPPSKAAAAVAATV